MAWGPPLKTPWTTPYVCPSCPWQPLHMGCKCVGMPGEGRMGANKRGLGEAVPRLFSSATTLKRVVVVRNKKW